MLTFLDDPELVRFLRSMPYHARRKLAIRAIGEYRLLAFGFILAATCLMLAIVGRMLGSRFGEETTGMFICVAVGGAVVGCWLAIYRNQRLRKLIAQESHDGLLVRCPVCMKQQAADARSNCECGCIVRLFVSSGL